MSLDSGRAGFTRLISSSNNVITITAKTGLEPQPGQSDDELEITYTDLRTIGNGSFGVVYLATLQRPTQEQVAIKKVLQDKRFKNRELQIMRKLDHCNVVKLKYYFHTCGERNNSEVYLHLVLEYIPETLYKIARNHSRMRRSLPMLLVKLYMYQLFRSLNYIHSMDICHRDIKPQNLLLDPDTGVLKLCDFGSAKSLVGGEPNVAYICSRYYRAPELIFGSTDYTTKIDIWSAGCVMAELILGEPMFPGETGVDQLVEIIKVLGTPTREQMRAMNRNYTEYRFPVIKARSWNRIFGHSRTPPEAARLVSNLLEYTPTNRLTPLAACAHPFFDELRSSSTRLLPNGHEFPPLFNFSEEELREEPHLRDTLMPTNSVTDTMTPQQQQQQHRNTIANTSTTSPTSSTSTSAGVGGISAAGQSQAAATSNSNNNNSNTINNSDTSNSSNNCNNSNTNNDDSTRSGGVNGPGLAAPNGSPRNQTSVGNPSSAEGGVNRDTGSNDTNNPPTSAQEQPPPPPPPHSHQQQSSQPQR